MAPSPSCENLEEKSNPSDGSHGAVVVESKPCESAVPAAATDTTVVPPPYSVYTTWEKRAIILGASLTAILSPLAAQIYLPTLNILADQFQVSDAEINFSVTTYMIFQGLTPMFIGSLADEHGRRPAYIICLCVFTVANIGLAVCDNYPSLLAIRGIQSAGAAATTTLCQAVLADIITSAERGHYVGIAAIPAILGPSLGPLLGGTMSYYLGWRSIFWFLTICGGVDLLLILLFFPETCRKVVGDGSIFPPRINQTWWQLMQNRRQARKGAATVDVVVAAAGPKKSSISYAFQSLFLLLEKELGCLLVFAAVIFGGVYAIATPIPSQFAAVYGLDTFHASLVYLPLAAGSIVAVFLVGPALNWNFLRHARKAGMELHALDKKRYMDLSDFPIEKARIEVALPALLLSILVMVSWGWALEKRAPLAVPCVLVFLIGASLVSVNNVVSAVIADIHPGKAGSASAANNITKCAVGAALTAVIQPLITALGTGWSYTVVGGLYVVCAPLLFIVMSKGKTWRGEMRERERAKAQKPRSEV